MNTRLAPIDSQTLYERAYESLSDAIMNGGFASGETLTIRGVAQQLGTSAMPAREALRRLATEGALTMLPNRSIRIPDMDAARVSEICRLRALLEGEAAGRAADCRSQAELEAVRCAHRGFVKAVKAGAPQQVLLAGQQFHFAIYAIAQLPTTFSIIRMLWLQSGPWLGEPLRSSFNRVQTRSYAEFVRARHQDLLEALEAGNAARASAAIAMELDGAARYLTASIAEARPDGREERLVDL